MSGKDTVERAIATAVQALLAIGTVGAAPIVLPGLPTWIGVLAGVVLAVAAAVAKSLGVSAQTAATITTVRQTVDATADQVTPVFANTNIPVTPAPVITLTEPGHIEARAAAQFDQPTG